MPPDAAHLFLRDLVLDRAPSASSTDLRWPRVVELLCLHGLESLAVSRHREPGAGFLPPEVAATLEGEYRRVGLWTTLLGEAAARARAALGEAGVASLLFKGSALVAGGLYADPGARRMDDADILVQPADAEAAVRALERAGFARTRRWHPTTPRWADSAGFVDPASPPGLPVSLDLHWRIAFGRLRFGDAGQATEAAGPLWEGADTALGLPAPESHLVVIAEHLLKHLRLAVHLRGLADLARLAAAEPDWERVVALARQSRLSAGLGHLLAGLAAEAPASIPLEPLRVLIRGAPLARPLAGELLPSALVEAAAGKPGLAPTGRGHGMLLRWRLLGSPRAVLQDVLHAGWPNARWLRARYGPGAPMALRLRYIGRGLRWLAGRDRPPASPHPE